MRGNDNMKLIPGKLYKITPSETLKFLLDSNHISFENAMYIKIRYGNDYIGTEQVFLVDKKHKSFHPSHWDFEEVV